jgi:hypothetical protein
MNNTQSSSVTASGARDSGYAAQQQEIMEEEKNQQYLNNFRASSLFASTN